MPYLPVLGSPGLIIKGWSHVLAGFPKTGKTELLLRASTEWEGKTLSISEEPAGVWDERLKTWPDEYPLDNVEVWCALGTDPGFIFKGLADNADCCDHFIIDFTRDLIQLETETDNSQIAAALRPIVVLSRKLGKTLVLLHHTTKAGGKNGRAIAGGHAFLGVVDVFLELNESGSNYPNRRKLTGRGRVHDVVDLTYEKQGKMFKAVGDNPTLERIRAALPDDGSWVTQKQVEEKSGISGSTVARHLAIVAERDPPISEDAQGKRVRWRGSKQA